MATLKEWEASLESKRTKQNLKYLKESKLVFDPIRHNATDKSDTTVVYAETGKENPSNNGMFTYSPVTMTLNKTSYPKEKVTVKADNYLMNESDFSALHKEFGLKNAGDTGNGLMRDFVFGMHESVNFKYDKVEYFNDYTNNYIVWTRNDSTLGSDCKEDFLFAAFSSGSANSYFVKLNGVRGDGSYIKLYGDSHLNNVRRLVAWYRGKSYLDISLVEITRSQTGGFKPICMPVAPSEEGKQYAAQGDQWVEVKAGGGSEEGALLVKFSITEPPVTEDGRIIATATANYSKKEILDAFRNKRLVYSDDSTSEVLSTRFALTVNSTGSDYYFSALDILKQDDKGEEFNTLVFVPIGSDEDSKDFKVYVNTNPFKDFVKDVAESSDTVYGRKNGEWVEIETGGSGDCNVEFLENEDDCARAREEKNTSKLYVDRTDTTPTVSVFRAAYIDFYTSRLDDSEPWDIKTLKEPTAGTDAEEAYNELNVHEERSSAAIEAALFGDNREGITWRKGNKAAVTHHGNQLVIASMYKYIEREKHEVVVCFDIYSGFEIGWCVCNYGESFATSHFKTVTLGKDWDSSVEAIKKLNVYELKESYVDCHRARVSQIAMPIAPDNGYHIARGSDWKKFEEAPRDGKQYGMKNGKWAEIEAGGSSEGTFLIEVVSQEEEGGQPIVVFNRNLKEIKAAVAKGLPMNLIYTVDSIPNKFSLNATGDGDDIVLFCADAHYSRYSEYTTGGAISLYPRSNDDSETKFKMYTTSLIPEAPMDGGQYARMDGEWVDIESDFVAVPMYTISSDAEAVTAFKKLSMDNVYYINSNRISVGTNVYKRGLYTVYQPTASTKLDLKPIDLYPEQEATIKIDVATKALSSDNLKKVNEKYPYVQLYDSNADKIYRFNMAYPSTDLKNYFYIFDRHTFTFDQSKLEIADEGREYLIINGGTGEITRKTIK